MSAPLPPPLSAVLDLLLARRILALADLDQFDTDELEDLAVTAVLSAYCGVGQN